VSLILLEPTLGHTAIGRDAAVLVTGADGFVSPSDPEQGFFVDNVRLVSTWRWSVGGVALEPVGASAVEPDRWMGYYIASAYLGADPASETLELLLSRAIAPDHMSEEMTLTSYTRQRTRASFDLDLGAGFRALRGARHALDPAAPRSTWRDLGHGAWELTITRPARSLRVRFDAHGCSIRPARGHLRVRVRLDPHARARIVATLTAAVDDPAARGARGPRSLDGAGAFAASPRLEPPGVTTLGPAVAEAFARARDDLAAIALSPARIDTSSIQAAMLGVDHLANALAAQAERLGSGDEAWRDTSPALYALALAEVWAWTGDRARVCPRLDAALAGLRWMDTRCDCDADGLYECSDTAPNDGGDVYAALDESGGLAEPPVAKCEAQGYAFLAKVRLSQILAHVGRARDAQRLAREAGELQKRFVDRFWLDDLGFLAAGLDGEKRPIRTVASGPGHCLAAGIVPRALVRRVADRLLRTDMFSGWGVRTLSAEHPAYNPHGYRCGSVWPVEQGTFALGMALAGLHDDAERIVHASLDATSIFAHHRLPEAMSGHPRDSSHPFPAVSPRTAPRAGPASAVVSLVRALLGLVPSAATRRLFLEPHLPPWLPVLTLRSLHVGAARADIRFLRTPDGSSRVQVIDVRGDLDIVHRHALDPGEASAHASLPAR
jgi:hypothetical protein